MRIGILPQQLLRNGVLLDAKRMLVNFELAMILI